MPVLLHSSWTLLLSNKQYCGLGRLVCPVMVALNVEQVLLFICTVLFTEGIGAVLLKQIEFVESVHEMARTQ